MTPLIKPSVTAPEKDPHFESVANVVLLSLILGMVAYATDMYLPAFPAIGKAFGASPPTVQLSLSVFLYGNAAGQLFFGPLSDRFGRRPILLYGLVAYTVATFACAFAKDISSFLVFRAIQGAAAASGPVLIRALINDRLDRIQAAQMLALLVALMAFLGMLTPIAGGFLVQYRTWHWIFYAVGSIGIVLIVAVYFMTRETLPRERRLATLGLTEVVRGYVEIGRSHAFWCYVIPPTLMFASVFAYVGANSFLLIDKLGMEERYHGITYSIAAGAYVAGSLASRRLVHLAGIERAIAIGLGAGVCAAMGAAVASSLLALSIALVVLPAIAMFFFTALIVPIGLSTAVSLFPERAGSASAVSGFFQITVAGAATAMAAYLVTDSTLSLHVFTLGCCVAAGSLWFASRRIRGPAK